MRVAMKKVDLYIRVSTDEQGDKGVFAADQVRLKMNTQSLTKLS